MDVRHAYGIWLFLLLPFLMACVSAYLVWTVRPGTSRSGAVSAAFGSVIVSGLMMLLGKVDGLICLVMALPIAFVMVLAGVTVMYYLMRPDWRALAAGLPAALAVAFPFLVAFEGGAERALPVHEVVSCVRVNALPEAVWREVVAFRPIEAPPSGIFRFGIAYPVEARIEGEGAGALRYCVFSTGAFVEPVTVWDPPRELAFDVTENPPPMTELSPWGNLEPAHLEGLFTAQRGRFRLVADGEGGTVLEGTMWYTQSIFPDWYWSRLSNAIVHRIHMRVLEHIKECVEGEGADS